jgi:hypothetical protein
MNDKFDELARNMAQSVTRRGSLKKFGIGFAGIALTALGLANHAEARGCKPTNTFCQHNRQCCSGICVTDENKAGWCA